MAQSEFVYKIIEITHALVSPDSGTNSITTESDAGWDVQQIFARLGGDKERVFALLWQKRQPSTR